MMLLKSESGKKAVRITTHCDNFIAYYMQEDESKSLDQGFGQVLAAKTFYTEKYAVRWAHKQLGLPSIAAVEEK